ncbi:hypothetical protein [Pendulispora albinea]|uniref:Uncharacterized protein n=1 Tax=Pendulispora albinea TaxID=2741071 RepID=A0ABZ2LVB6_9BACT
MQRSVALALGLAAVGLAGSGGVYIVSFWVSPLSTAVGLTLFAGAFVAVFFSAFLHPRTRFGSSGIALAAEDVEHGSPQWPKMLRYAALGVLVLSVIAAGGLHWGHEMNLSFDHGDFGASVEYARVFLAMALVLYAIALETAISAMIARPMAPFALEARTARSTASPRAEASACSRCAVALAPNERLFSHDGQPLCDRCRTVADAHEQIDRAHRAAVENTVDEYGKVRLVAGIVREHAARWAAQEHAALARLPTSPPTATATIRCATCKEPAARAATTLNLEGEPMCPRCAAVFDPEEARREKEGSLWRGFALGFVFSVFGILYVFAVTRRPADKKGALGGFLTGLLPGAIYFVTFHQGGVGVAFMIAWSVAVAGIVLGPLFRLRALRTQRRNENEDETFRA